MASHSVDKVQVGYHRVENTETVSSPHTYAYSSGAAIPSTTMPDKPQISNITIASAVAGLPPNFFAQANRTRGVKQEKDAKEEEAAGHIQSGFPTTTRRVERMSFEMEHISPPVANMFRRLITTELPTLAFDRILIEENDSVVLDELLSHRLGLVPVAGPVAKMQYITDSRQAGFSNLDPTRVLVFELDVTGAKDRPSTNVYSSDLKFTPLAGQEEWVPRGGLPSSGVAKQEQLEEEEEEAEQTRTQGPVDEDQVFLVHHDILLTKLGPGQRLKLKAIAVKGIGAVHTKWSPVSACYYEMKRSIRIAEPVLGGAAEKLVSVCPSGVFGLDPKTGAAVVKNVAACTLCRECLRSDVYPEFAGKVKIEMDKTHVIFHIESVGQLHPTQIFRTALNLFAERCRALATVVQSTEVNVVQSGAKSLDQ